MPFVFAVSSPMVLTAAWTLIIAFLFLGIEELGAQVEQPFQVIPLWQLCNQLQEDIGELVLHPLNVTTERTDIDDGGDEEGSGNEGLHETHEFD